ncbi:MAG: hypothetical protein Q9164_006032 [Protoblastenia rupestris]
MVRGSERLMVVADINVIRPENVIPNVDMDEPGAGARIVPSTSNEILLTRMASIAGFGSSSSRGPGIIAASKPVDFSIVGLDIEGSTYVKRGGVPLPHDDIISITISNGGWHENVIEDVCFWVYTFGFYKEVELETGKKPVFVQANTSEDAVEKTYEILNALSSDFVNIRIGFGFDLKHIAAHCASTESLTHTFQKPRLGNTATAAVQWRLENGVSIVHSMYDIDKYLKKDWPSQVASVLGLPPKVDASEIIIENSESYDVTDMLV